MNDIVLSPIPLEDLRKLIKNCVEEGMKGNPENPHQPEEPHNYLTADEAAQFLKVSLVSIHNWKRDMGLPFYRIGRSIRFKKSELVAFTEKRNKKRAE